MAENEKLKPDLLKWWLGILIGITGLVWLFFTLLFGMCLYFPPTDLADFLYYLFIFGPPILLYLSWRNWHLGKRGMSIVLSILQIILTVFMVIIGLALIMVAGGGTGIC